MPVPIIIQQSEAQVFDAIQTALEVNTPYNLDRTEDIWEENLQEVMRAYFFSKDGGEAIILLRTCGEIYYHQFLTIKHISQRFMLDVIEVLLDLYYDGLFTPYQ